ncbi:MAG: glycosyltransferase family 2 protein [Candidatus Sumerlaeaceae bacterium]|nr:glycosyltransferase family 2 protein [Candidatus Sumerlaeaceae bacterium]
MTSSDTISSAPVTVIVPAHNESQAIERVVRDIYGVLVTPERPAAKVEVLVVDDGSTDDTARQAEMAGARVVRHEENLGYGAALKTGIRAASHEIILTTDGDGTYPAAAMPRLLEELACCDMAVGARTGTDVHIPWERRPAKWLLTRLAVYLSQKPIPDLNSGLRAFRRQDVLPYLRLCPSGFSFSTTITLAFLCNDRQVRYVAIDYHPRVGKSKLRPLRDTKNILLTIVRSIIFFNPLRVFVPLAMTMFAAATVVALFVRDSHGNILDGTISILVLGGIQMIMLGFLAEAIARLR